MNIKDYLHYYLGQQYRHKSVEWLDWSGWFTLKGADIDAIMHPHMQGLFIQFALRRMEDMTEEEAIKLGEMLLTVNGEKCRAYKTDSGQWRVQYGNVSGQHWLIDGSIFNQHQTIYLLSSGFDLFGFINAGLAIDSKTVTI